MVFPSFFQPFDFQDFIITLIFAISSWNGHFHKSQFFTEGMRNDAQYLL